jgi:hypothetical protein
LIAQAVGAYSQDGNVGRPSFSFSDVRGHGGRRRVHVAYIAHYDFGLSRREIRTPAVVGAAVIAVLVAIEFFGKKLRQLK